MQLSEQTIKLLKNFSNINSGIWIEQGNELVTTSKNKNIIATAVIDNSFPNSFGIYDLNTLLSIFSLHKITPELEFDKHNLIISGLSGRSKIKYRYCAEEMLVIPPKKRIELPSNDIEFVLEEDDYKWICNAANILDSENIAITSDGTEVKLHVFDLKNDSAHNDALLIDVDPEGVKYNIIFEFDLWNKLLEGSYEVTVYANDLNSKNPIAMAKFVHRSMELEYVLLVHEDSTYEVQG